MFQKSEVSNISRSLVAQRLSQELDENARSFRYLFTAFAATLVLLVMSSIIQAKISIGLCLIAIGVGIVSLLSFLNNKNLHGRSEELKKKCNFEV